jgi:hypothetical protein
MKIGDIVKSYDFLNMKSCYIIGRVIEVKDNRFTASIIKAVSEDKEYKMRSEEFSSIVMGAGMFDNEWDFDRVEIIG